MWLLNFYNKYYLCGCEEKINYTESLYLPIYLEISKITLLLNSHGEIFVKTALSVKIKLPLCFSIVHIFSYSCVRGGIYLKFY